MDSTRKNTENTRVWHGVSQNISGDSHDGGNASFGIDKPYGEFVNCVWTAVWGGYGIWVSVAFGAGLRWGSGKASATGCFAGMVCDGGGFCGCAAVIGVAGKSVRTGGGVSVIVLCNACGGVCDRLALAQGKADKFLTRIVQQRCRIYKHPETENSIPYSTTVGNATGNAVFACYKVFVTVQQIIGNLYMNTLVIVLNRIKQATEGHA